MHVRIETSNQSMRLQTGKNSASVLPQVLAQKRPEGYVLNDSTRRNIVNAFLIIFTIGWNAIWCSIGIIFFFVFRQQNSIVALFINGILLLFAIVGIILVIITIRSLMVTSAFKPAELTFPSWPLRLGERTNVTFRQQARNVQISKIEAKLRCTEEVSYHVGTDTRTVSEVIWEQALPSSDLPSGLNQAEAQWRIEIPRDMPPSFTSFHNHIEWSIYVKLHSPRFPDAESYFLLVVLPEMVG